MIPCLSKRRAYTGGPNFDQLSTLCFDLEGIGLELTIPASDFAMAEPPRLLNLPFNGPGWFEAHCKRRSLHDYVPLFTEMWGYFPAGLSRMFNLMAMSSNQRMGELSLGLHLNKLKGGTKLDLGNPQSLGDYIKWEYEELRSQGERGAAARKTWRELPFAVRDRVMRRA
jgi:hypothetical protein